MTDVLTPIDRYLAEQQDGSAVERFARYHEADLLDSGERWYSDRLPVSAPGPGEQYAFRVDLDQCTGCKACVAACHSLNGLDEHESWRSVGLLVGRDADRPRQQSVPSGCHHCLEPACLSGCPSNAYEKDPISGIVSHLDDQCIGCGYCELTCPYEVPELNSRLGIVRKCDMCADRLADGEAPACVQACPTSAITITTVDRQEVRAASQSGSLVPGAPASALTAPTTQYVGGIHPDDDLRAADHHAVHLSRSHPPLVFMLVVTQLSVGAFLTTLMADRLTADPLPAGAAAVSALVGIVALAASVLHLGRPAVAWRAVLGLGHSWLSREIVAFAAYALCTVAYAVSRSVPATSGGLATVLGVAAATTGVAGVACSAQLYAVTRRTFWRARSTYGRFAGTAALTGPLLVTVVVLFAAPATGPGGDVVTVVVPCAFTTVVVSAIKLTSEVTVRWPGRFAEDSDMARTARLLTGPLAVQGRWRFGLGVLGGIVGPWVVAATVVTGPGSMTGPAVVAGLSLLCVVLAELIERYHFFLASVTPRMPGGFRR